MLEQGYLNSEFTEGLKAAFEQPNCVLSTYVYLANKGHENTKEKKHGLTRDTW